MRIDSSAPSQEVTVRDRTGNIVAATAVWSPKYKAWHRPGTSDMGMLGDCANHYKAVYAHPALRDSTVLDLGANIGAFARLAIQAGARKVVCVEPEPTNVGMMMLNLRDLVEAEKVEIVEAALVEEGHPSQWVSFFMGSSNNAQCSGSLTKQNNRKNLLTVRGVKLSELEKKYGRFPVIKCDIEGGEYAVLEDGLLQKDRDVLALELHAGSESNKVLHDKWFDEISKKMHVEYYMPSIVFGKPLNTDVVFYRNRL